MIDPNQYRFCDGELVLDEGTTDLDDKGEPIEPGNEIGYRVAVKPRARSANATLRGVDQERG